MMNPVLLSALSDPRRERSMGEAEVRRRQVATHSIFRSGSLGSDASRGSRAIAVQSTQEVSASPSNSTQTAAFGTYAYREGSLSKKAHDFTTVALEFALPIADGVPVAGGPMKAVIGVLLKILTGINVSLVALCASGASFDLCHQQASQNKNDAVALMRKLNWLLGHISAQTPQPGARHLREDLTR